MLQGHRRSRYGPRADWVGKTLLEIARAEKVEPLELAIQISRKGGASIVNFCMSEDDVRRVRQDEKRREAEGRNLRYRRRKEVEDRLSPIENEVARLESRARELEAAQADPAVYRDSDRARDVAREKGEIDKRLQELYVDWERLADELGP